MTLYYSYSILRFLWILGFALAFYNYCLFFTNNYY